MKKILRADNYIVKEIFYKLDFFFENVIFIQFKVDENKFYHINLINKKYVYKSKSIHLNKIKHFQ